MTDAESPLGDDPITVGALFYPPHEGSPWWMRRLWRPRFCHVNIQVGGVILNMPKAGTFGCHSAADYISRRQPHGAIDGQWPGSRVIPILGDIVRDWNGRDITEVKAALALLGIRTVHGTTCVTAARQWLFQLTGLATTALTPDRLYDELSEMVHVPEE